MGKKQKVDERKNKNKNNKTRQAYLANTNTSIVFAITLSPKNTTITHWP
jgi:hypothetical protein